MSDSLHRVLLYHRAGTCQDIVCILNWSQRKLIGFENSEDLVRFWVWRRLLAKMKPSPHNSGHSLNKDKSLGNSRTSIAFPQGCSQAPPARYMKRWAHHLPLPKPVFILETLTPLSSRCSRQNSGGLLDSSVSSIPHFKTNHCYSSQASLELANFFLLHRASQVQATITSCVDNDQPSNWFPASSVFPYNLFSTLKPVTSMLKILQCLPIALRIKYKLPNMAKSLSLILGPLPAL